MSAASTFRRSPGSTGAAPTTGTAGYGGKLALTRLAMVWERLWRAFWPAAAAASLFVSLALFGALPALPGWLHALALAAFAVGLAVLVRRGAGAMVLPRRAEARRRLELSSGLAHRPLQTLDDRLADGLGGAEAERLWRAHRARMRELAARLTVAPPRPAAAARDPLALRFAAALVLAAALAVGGADADRRLAAALAPDFPPAAPGAPAVLELWISPPDYTGLAPIFPGRAAAPPERAGGDAPSQDVADAGPQVIPVPANSVLTARLSGGAGDAVLVQGAARTPFEQIDARNAAIEAPVAASGRLAILQDGRALGEWRIAVVADRPPTIDFTAPPKETGRKALAIPFAAEDDYGIERAGAQIRRSYERGAVVGAEVEELELPLAGPARGSARETSYHDLTPHRWAGLPVAVRLWASDATGQTAFSEDAFLTLPEREFRHPVARAVVEQRKRLAAEPERREPVARALAGIASRPADFSHHFTAFLALSSARARLARDPEPGAAESVGRLLWQTALGIEEGRLSIAERELRRAQQALAEALARDAPDSELERLMDELRQALDRFMNDFAERMRRQGDDLQAMPRVPPGQVLEREDMRRMMDRLRDLVRSGARESARQMLARLREMLENLRAGRAMQATPQMRAESRALRSLQDLIQRQTTLMDRSYRQSQSPRGPRPTQSRLGAEAQRAIREALGQLRETLGRLGMDRDGGTGRAFDRADRDMGAAAGALDRNAPGDSVGPQGRAIEALRSAGEGLARRMAERMGRQGNGPGLGQSFDPLRLRRDPFGRLAPGPQGVSTRDMAIPDEDAVDRSRRILRELRRRSGQRQRPRLELDYIDRLLQRF